MTQFDLWKKYVTESVPMAEAAGINTWECVKYVGYVCSDHPNFTGNLGQYTFALTVLEKTPIFPGMTVYNKHSGNGHVVHGDAVIEVLQEDWTTTPPTKKRTFTMEFDEEEMEFLTECHTARIVHISLSRSLNYRAKQILDAARDKE